MSVSLSTAEEQAFESVAGPPVNEAAADRDAEREDYDDDIYGDEDGDLAPARYMVGLLTTPEERETAKALRVAKDLRKSAQIVNKYNGERNELRRQLDDDNERKYKAKELHKKEMLLRWSKKLDKSSFLVDLVAESERIDEEQVCSLFTPRSTACLLHLPLALGSLLGCALLSTCDTPYPRSLSVRGATLCRTERLFCGRYCSGARTDSDNGAARCG